MPPSPVDQLPLTVPVFHILLSVAEEPRHGYAVIQDVAARTDGEVRLTASTLYGAVARMLDAGLLEEHDPPPGQERRRLYAITRRGRGLLTDEARRLARSAEWARTTLLSMAPRHGGRR